MPSVVEGLPSSTAEPPPAGTLERWCWDFILESELERKLSPGAPPALELGSSWEAAPRPLRLQAPGRPREWQLVGRSRRTPKLAALVQPEARCRLLHTFLHHELQAAELFAWAYLAFPETPREFRAGLLRLCGEELGHLALYREHLVRLGGALGRHGARDWFWERALTCETPASFLAFQGLGLEGANLDHSARFAAGFRAAGDEVGAGLLERVGRDEERHVAFAIHWFEFFRGALNYEAWCQALPAPLTPAVFKGNVMNLSARSRAGMGAEFLKSLGREPPARGPR